jgi:hypothetical protein
VKYTPIPFSGEMVRAILAGGKTQTRRVVKPQPPREEHFVGSSFGLSRCVADGIKMYSQNDWERLPKHPTDWELIGSVGVARDAGYPKRYRCPYGQPGDRLWVKESYFWFRIVNPEEKLPDGAVFLGPVTDWCTEDFQPYQVACFYEADGPMPDIMKRAKCKWKRATYMFRWASRITLEIVSVRVERLNDISEDDAGAEGVDPWKVLDCTGVSLSCRVAFANLWESIHGSGSWEANPWVWVVEFKVVES